MSVPMISSVRDAIKNMALEFKWEERKRNPGMQKGGIMDEMERINKQNEQHRKSMIRLGIEGKLKSGKKLSSADMEYLRKNEPDLYEKAVRIEKEREEYRRELERCKTKDEVRELNMRKITLLDAEVKAIKQSGMSASAKQEAIEIIGMRMAAITSEHAEFTKSPKYGELPTREELERDEKRKKQEKRSVLPDSEFWREKYKKPVELKTRCRENEKGTGIQKEDEANAENGESLLTAPDGVSAETIGHAGKFLEKDFPILDAGELPGDASPGSLGLYTSNGKRRSGAKGRVSVDA